MSSEDSMKPVGDSLSRGSRQGLFVVPKQPKSGHQPVKTFLSGGQVVIQSEFSEKLDELTKAYMAEYQPATATENMLVRDLATSQCRCDYVLRLREQPGISADEKMVATLTRYHATNQRIYKRSLRTLKSIQKERAREATRKPHLVTRKTVGEC